MRGQIKTENAVMAGCLATVLTWISYQVGLDMPAEVAAAFATLAIAAVSFIKGT